MNNTTTPHRYIYLDAEGIESLYAQIVEQNISEVIQKNGKANKGKISGKIGLGKLFGPFLKLIDIEITPEIEKADSLETTTKSSLSPEHKLRDLLSHLEQLGEPYLFSDINKAAEYCRKCHDAVFINITDNFDAPQFYSGQGHVDVTASKAILFEKNICKDKDTYDHNDDYYKKIFNSKLRIAMATSLMKYPSYKNGHMGATSHEALTFRGYGGFDIPLNIFGSFFNTHSFFQIKPYAIRR